jgi:hypothetical protein
MAFKQAVTPGGRSRSQGSIGRNIAEFDTGEMRRNLLEVLALADKATEREGLAWYPSAHSIGADLAIDHGATVAQAAGVIAALSPQNGWGSNVAQAGQAFGDGHAGNVGHYDDATGKATEIIAGADPDGVLGGRKVRSFYRNIVDPLRPGHVTIDRHMVDLLTGERFADAKVLERVGVYQLAAAVIRGVARELGMLPQEVQAVAWVAWRKLHDVAYRFDGAEF